MVKTLTVQELLFHGFSGCSDHNCVVETPKGMGTNGGCSCITSATRAQLRILQSRISLIKNLDSGVQKPGVIKWN